MPLEVRFGLWDNKGDYIVADNGVSFIQTDMRHRPTAEMISEPERLRVHMSIGVVKALRPALERIWHGGKSGAGPFCDCHHRNEHGVLLDGRKP